MAMENFAMALQICSPCSLESLDEMHGILPDRIINLIWKKALSERIHGD